MELELAPRVFLQTRRAFMADGFGNRKVAANSGAVIGIAAAAFAVLLIVAFVWTGHEKQAARNDSRVGTTTEISPNNPRPAPGGGANKGG